MGRIQKLYDWMGDAFSFEGGQFVRNYGQVESDTGEKITETSSLKTIVLLRCVTLIAGAAASLPIDVGERRNGTRNLLENHPIEKILDSTPNDLMSSMDLRSHQWLSFLLWGNSFDHIVWDRDRIIAMWPLFPHLMEIKRDPNSNDLIYKYSPQGKEAIEYPAKDILHVRWHSLDGIVGMNPIQLARNGIGLHRSTEKSVGQFFKNNGFSAAQMKFPANMTQKQVNQVRDDFTAQYAVSSGGAYKLAVMSGGSEIEPIGVNPKDAQFLEERNYNDVRICMLFGVPPHMVGLTNKQTSWGTGIESQKQGFLDFTIAPLLTFFEKAYERALLSKSEERLYIKHNTRAFLRADFKGRMEAHGVAVDKGIENRDEVRASEDWNPIEDGSGKIYTVQAQMIPLNMVGKIPQPSKPPENQTNAKKPTLADLINEFDQVRITIKNEPEDKSDE